MSEIEKLEEAEAKGSIEITKLQQGINDLNENLKTHGQKDIRDTQLQDEKLIGEHALANEELKLSGVNIEINEIEKRLIASETNEPKLNKIHIEITLYQDLRKIFQETLDALGKQLKEDIESDDSEIFKTLATDKEYSGLKINDRYGLQLYDSSNMEVPLKGAGVEQIIARSPH